MCDREKYPCTQPVWLEPLSNENQSSQLISSLVFFQEVQKDRTTSTTFFFIILFMGLFSAVLKAYIKERGSHYLPLDELPSEGFVALPAKEH